MGFIKTVIDQWRQDRALVKALKPYTAKARIDVERFSADLKNAAGKAITRPGSKYYVHYGAYQLLVTVVSVDGQTPSNPPCAQL